MFRVSSLIFHATNGRAQRIFLPLFPLLAATFPNTSGFANPRYFTAVMQPRASFQFLSRLLPEYVSAADRPEQPGRAPCDLQLNIYGRGHRMQRGVRSLSAVSNQERTLSLCIMSDRVTVAVMSRCNFNIYPDHVHFRR